MSANDDERIGTYAAETSKDLVCKKKKVKCNNIIKQLLTLMMLQKKT